MHKQMKILERHEIIEYPELEGIFTIPQGSSNPTPDSTKDNPKFIPYVWKCFPNAPSTLAA